MGENSLQFLSSDHQGGVMQTWQPLIASAVFRKALCPASTANPQGPLESSGDVENGHHHLSNYVEDAVDSRMRHPKRSGNHKIKRD